MGEGGFGRSAVTYTNGLKAKDGNVSHDMIPLYPNNGANWSGHQPCPIGDRYVLGAFAPGERITSGSITTGVGAEGYRTVLGVTLLTNHGRSLAAEACFDRGDEDSEEFKDVDIQRADYPLSKGNFKGFFGRGNDYGPDRDGHVYRLGFVWRPPPPAEAASEERFNHAPSCSGEIVISNAFRERWNDASAPLGRRYRDAPTVICALSEARGCHEMPLPLGWIWKSNDTYKAWAPTITKDRLTIRLVAPRHVHHLTHS